MIACKVLLAHVLVLLVAHVLLADLHLRVTTSRSRELVQVAWAFVCAVGLLVAYVVSLACAFGRNWIFQGLTLVALVDAWTIFLYRRARLATAEAMFQFYVLLAWTSLVVVGGSLAQRLKNRS